MRMNQQADQDRDWMRRALELARRGIGISSPNPAVGCVILNFAGQLAGEGWHEYDRRDHAEVAALKAARQHTGEHVRGGTAYVTLEPCNHTGRTGPCTEALIAAGVKRVVAATIDPNPSVAGHGMERLRAAGLETAVGVCESEARRLNEGFACWSQHRRPLVLMKVAMSLDGRIAPPSAGRPPQQPFWITGKEARRAVQALRWQADAVVTGVGTVLADDPLLTDRSGLSRRRPLLRVVLDSALRTPLDSKIVTTAQGDVLIFTVSTDEARIRALGSRGVRVEVLPAELLIRQENRAIVFPLISAKDAEMDGARWQDFVAGSIGVPGGSSAPPEPKPGRVPLPLVLDKLGEEGILTLLTETGARLNTVFLAGGLVDRLQLFVSPQIMGSGALPAFLGLANPLRIGQVEAERCGGDLLLDSLLCDPWPETGSEMAATDHASE